MTRRRPGRHLKDRAIDVMLRQHALLVTDRIARAIVEAAPRPPDGPDGDLFRDDRIRHAQAMADALIARRAGEADGARP